MPQRSCSWSHAAALALCVPMSHNHTLTCCVAEIGRFADQLRSAVTHAAHETDKSWSATGSSAGSTLTVALVAGQLLTIGNVGDSTAILDTGALLCLLRCLLSCLLSATTHRNGQPMYSGCCPTREQGLNLRWTIAIQTTKRCSSVH